jgi:hypothetical protein
MVMMILALFAAVAVSLVTTGSNIGLQEEQGVAAFYIAEGGLEYILKNQSFPNYSLTAAKNLGDGSFTVATPAYLTADPGVADTTITVNSTASFPASGRIVIDSELITYTGKTATQFNAGVVRGAGGTKASAHTAGNAVYPATTVTDNPLVAGSVTINVASTVGFLIPGIIKIDEEYIYCTGTNAPATTQFTGCTRGYKGSTADSHPQLRNVFQYTATSTGTITSNPLASPIKRVVKKTVAGKGNSFYKGWFPKNGAVGNQVISGIGFQPTAVIFYWTRQTAEGFSANESMGFGFASVAGQRAIAIESDDNATRTNYSHIRSDTSVILMLQAPAAAARATATLNASASLVSLDADGFTLNWTLNENRADIIHYIALGGDITSAFVGTLNSNTVVGNQSVTGLTFKPDFVMLLNGSLDRLGENVNTPYPNKVFNIGFMTSSAQGAIAVCGQDDLSTANHSRNQQRTDRVLMSLLTTDCRNQDSLANYVSMNNYGFTINWSDPPLNSLPIFYLALKGGQHKVSFLTEPAATGNQTTAGVGFQPQGLFLASFNRIASNLIAIQGEISIGSAQSSASQGAIWSESRDVNPGRTDANMATFTTQTYIEATTQTTSAEAAFFSFNSDSFTLNWTKNDGTSRQILYWAIGPDIASSGMNIKPVNLDWREVFP